MRGVTREQKLALIVGFSLVLLVGVLISDHLSGARKAKIAKVEPETPPVSVAPIPAPGPAAESRIATAPTNDPALQLILGPQASPPAANPSAANPPAANPPAPIAVGGGVQSPGTTPTSAPVNPPAGSDPIRTADGTLHDAIRNNGGNLVRNPDGSWSFELPKSEPKSVPVAQANPKIVYPNLGPIEPLKTHVVKSGESLFQITNKYYGTGNLWKQLAKFNGMDNAGTIRVGSSIKIPSKEVLLGRAVASGNGQNPEVKIIKPAPGEAKPAAPKAAPADRGKPKIELASYTVRQGDTLGDISLKTLGTSRRWQEIAELNKLDDEDSISAGTVLKIPAKRS